MKSYKELEVWQKALDLVVEVYRLATALPPEEKYGLATQMQRAAVSVPANIAEGWGRGSTKEYIQFLRVARGSLMELETHAIIAQKLSFLSEEDREKIQAQIESIGMMLNRLIQSLTKQ